MTTVVPTQTEVDMAYAFMAWKVAERKGLLTEDERTSVTLDLDKCRDLWSVCHEHDLHPDPDMMVPYISGLIERIESDASREDCQRRAEQIWQGLAK